MKELCILVGGILVLAISAVADGAEIKLGFVDLQRALNESEAGKVARDSFVKEMERLQVNLRNEKEELDRLREDFDKKAMLLREDDRLAMEQELEDKGLDFKRKYEDYQRQLKRTDNEYTGAILRELEEVIKKVGAREGYTVVFEAQSSGVLYGNPAVDLTAEILREYNAGKPRAKKK